MPYEYRPNHLIEYVDQALRSVEAAADDLEARLIRANATPPRHYTTSPLERSH